MHQCAHTIWYKMDSGSEAVLNSAVRKLRNDLKNKWLTYLERYGASCKNLRVFSAWLKNTAQVQENMILHFGSASDKTKPIFIRDEPKTTSFAAASDFGF